MAPKSQTLWHRIWKECHPTWKKHFPEDEYEHFMWTDEKLLDFVEEEYPEYLFLYYSFPCNILKLDFARALILHKYGGIYVDMDYFCVENFYGDLNKNLVLVESPAPLETVQNSLMCSKKGHKFWMKYCDLMEYRYGTTKLPKLFTEEFDKYVLHVTGPMCLKKSLKVYNEKNKVQILDKNFYNPIQYEINKKICKQIKCFHALTGLWGKSHYNDSASNIEEMENYQMKIHKTRRYVDFYDVISYFK